MPISSTLGFYLADSEGRWLWCSDRLAALIGCSAKDLLDFEWKKAVHAEDREAWLAYLLDSKNTTGACDRVFRIFHPDGRLIPIRLFGEWREDETKKATIHHGAILLWEHGAETLEEIRRAQKSKADFLATVSHELRTPLNGILGMAGLLLETHLDDSQRDFARILQASGENLLTLINNILDFARAETGEIEIDPIPFELSTTLRDIADVYAIRSAEKGLEFKLHLDQTLPDCSMGDPGRIRQVLDYLLDNAIRFTESGEVELSARILGLTNAHAASIEFSVRDTGSGLPSRHFTSQVEPFTQDEPVMTRKLGGLGLGLAVAQRLLTLMGSRLQAQSTPGQGTVFRFELHLPTAPPAIAHSASYLQGRRILIVDPFDVDRRVTGEYLVQAGCLVEEATHAEAALALLASKSGSPQPAFDLVIAECQLGGLSSEALGHHLGEAYRQSGLKWIAIASQAERGDAQRMQLAGYRGFLVKPVDGPTLLETVTRVLAQSSDEPSVMITRHSLKEGRLSDDSDMDAEGLRILIADDNPVSQKVLRQFLSKKGCRVDMASHGLQALASFERSTYDLIFMDCSMPELDGLETTRRIRAMEKTQGRTRTPIVALTAHALSHSHAECLAAGMDGFLTKPFKRETLWLELKRHTPTRKRPSV